MLVSALITGSVIFAAGYVRQVQQAVVEVAFAENGPSNSWSLTGPARVDLSDLLSADAGFLAQEPIAGRTSSLVWRSPRFPDTVRAGLVWRDDVCAHLVLTAGRCPDAVGEVAVSAADAENFRVEVGDQVTETAADGPRTLAVAGVYRPTDPREPYWFGGPPVGRSGFDAGDRPVGDQVIAVRDQFSGAYAETLDGRIDGSGLRVADLDGLGAATETLRRGARERGAQLVTGVPATLSAVAGERSRAATGMSLPLGQLGVLVLVVIALLASVEVAAQRAELGLARIRGETAVRLGRHLVVGWGAAVLAGWLTGWVAGTALLAWTAARLPGDAGAAVALAVGLAALVALIAMVVAILPPARSVLAEPAVDLIRSDRSPRRDERGRQLLLEVSLVVLSASGFLVALQVGTGSVLGLLAPSLLAVGTAVLLFRAVAHLAERRRRFLVRGQVRPRPLLASILLVRLRGLKLLTVTTALAAAFVVFAVQVQVIGSTTRRHEAEVTTGAGAVLRVEGPPGAVLDVLDRLDPQHDRPDATMTAVVVTRRRDPGSLRGMFVEPAGFERVALGAGRTSDEAGWASITAPAVEPLTITGNAVAVQLDAHPDLRSTSTGPVVETGTRATLGLQYLGPDAELRSVSLGQIQLEPSPATRLQAKLDCAESCRLLRITLDPNGPMSGVLQVAALATVGARVDEPVDLGDAGAWQTVPSTVPGPRLEPVPDVRGLALRASSGGLPIAVQYAWAPVVLPVLVGAATATGGALEVAAPDGIPVPVREVARARDAVPRELGRVAVGDLASVLRSGHRTVVPEATTEIWVATAAVGRLDEVRRELQQAGIPVVATDTVQQAVTRQRTSAAALTGQITPGLAVLAVLFAALGIVLTVAQQQALLRRDLSALTLAGTDRATVRRATVSAYLLPVLLAAAVGAIAGAAGCTLVIASLPLLPNPHPEISTDLGLRGIALLLTAGGVVAAFAVVAQLAVRRLLARVSGTRFGVEP